MDDFVDTYTRTLAQTHTQVIELSNTHIRTADPLTRGLFRDLYAHIRDR